MIFTLTSGTTISSSATPGRRDSLVGLLQDVELPTTAAGMDLTKRRVSTVLGPALEAPLEDAESPLPIFMLAQQLSEESADSGMDSSDDVSGWTPGVIEAAVHQQQQQLPAMQMLALKPEPEHRSGAFLFPPTAPTSPTSPSSPFEFGYSTGSDSDGSVTPPPAVFGALPRRKGGQVGRPQHTATPQERKLRKQASNRRAALKFRQKKKMEQSNLFVIVARLEQQNAALQRELALIKALRR